MSTCMGYTANWFAVPAPGTLRVTARWAPAHYDCEPRYVSGCPERATGTVEVTFVPR